MHRQLIRWAMIVATGSGLALGCNSSGKHEYPDAPLLQSKEPVAGNVDAPRPMQVADAEPTAPQAPDTALVILPDNRGPAASLGQPIGSVPSSAPQLAAEPAPTSPFHTASRAATPPVFATPAVRARDSGDIMAQPAIRGKVTGWYSHNDDYTHLQGKLEKHYRGWYSLRYSDPSQTDRWGGKVTLDSDPILDQFKPGDIIVIDGALNHEPDPGQHEGWKHHPRFHVTSAQLVERKP